MVRKMRAIFYVANKPRERLLAEAMKVGMSLLGDSLTIVPSASYVGPDDSFDLTCFFGVKSRQLFRDYRNHDRRGHILYIDKAYVGRGEYYRFIVDDTQPNAYLHEVPRASDRWDWLKIELQPLQPEDPRKHVLFAGSSQKYCDFHSLGDATAYARKFCKRVRNMNSREIVYRPKPTWGDAEPIEGTTFSGPDEKLSSLFSKMHVLITHGSGAAVEAIIAGVPAITLGNGVTHSVTDRSLNFETVRKPFFPDDAWRKQFMCDLAYTQFTRAEWVQGGAWPTLREVILRRG